MCWCEIQTKQMTRRWLFWTTRVSVAIIRRSGCSTKGASYTSNTVPPRGRDIAAAVSDDAARLRLTLRSLRRQLVRQLRPLAFDHGSHVIRDVVDVPLDLSKPVVYMHTT